VGEEGGRWVRMRVEEEGREKGGEEVEEEEGREKNGEEDEQLYWWYLVCEGGFWATW
jgi:hypothetical protein